MTQKTTAPARVSTKITKKEKTEWSKLFADYGSKKACYDATGVKVANIRNIVNKGRGLIENVEKLRNYTLKIQLEKKFAEEKAIRSAMYEAERAAESLRVEFPTIAA